MNEENKNISENQTYEEQAVQTNATPVKTEGRKLPIVPIVLGVLGAVIILLVVLALGKGGGFMTGMLGGGNLQAGNIPGGVQLPDIGNGTEDAPGNPDRDSFIADLGGVSETFEGAVSEKSYKSADKAAEAYVSEEIVGEANAILHSVTSKGQLSDSDIASLNLPSSVADGYDSIELMEVKYAIGTAAAYSRSGGADENDERTVQVIVIKYGTDWKYFTPRPVNGETISKSYYDSVFNFEKYKNCTMVYNYDLQLQAAAMGEVMDISIKIVQTIKYAGDRIYIDQLIIQTGAGQNETYHMYLYLEQKGTSFTCYVKSGDNGSWTKGSLTAIGFNSVEELTPFYDQYLDYTYFTKTSYGFAINKENARAYFMQALAGSLGNVEEVGIDNMDIDMYAEYYVSGGVLSGMKLDCQVDFEMHANGESGTASESVLCEIKCFDYGTTTVDKPAGIK